MWCPVHRKVILSGAELYEALQGDMTSVGEILTERQISALREYQEVAVREMQEKVRLRQMMIDLPHKIDLGNSWNKLTSPSPFISANQIPKPTLNSTSPLIYYYPLSQGVR